MAAYYGLRHPDNRTTLYGYFSADGSVLGFLASARTGLDLFRPLLIPFVAQPAAMAGLLRDALLPGRPALLHVPMEQRDWALDVAEMSDARTLELLRCDPRAFQPLINVLVVESKTDQDWPRYEIKSRDVVQAASGINWMGEKFGEIYVESTREGQTRGFRRSVLASIVLRLLSERRIPLFRVPDEDAPAQMEAVDLGFRRTGERTVLGQIVLREPGPA
jgi:hypothetical protein